MLQRYIYIFSRPLYTQFTATHRRKNSHSLYNSSKYLRMTDDGIIAQNRLEINFQRILPSPRGVTCCAPDLPEIPDCVLHGSSNTTRAIYTLSNTQDDSWMMQNYQSTSSNLDESTPKRAKRPRAAQACDRCRLKKYKCDEQYPCSHCKSTESPILPIVKLLTISQKACSIVCIKGITESEKAAGLPTMSSTLRRRSMS